MAINVKDKNFKKTLKAIPLEPEVAPKEHWRQQVITKMRERWNGEEPVSGETYMADGWYYVVSVGSIPYSALLEACRRYDNTVKLPDPTKDDPNGSPSVEYLDSLDGKKVRFLELNAVGDRRNLDKTRCTAVMVMNPDTAAMFESEEHFVSIPVDTRPLSKLH